LLGGDENEKRVERDAADVGAPFTDLAEPDHRRERRRRRPRDVGGAAQGARIGKVGEREPEVPRVTTVGGDCGPEGRRNAA
jgi:hypothetical protein